MKNSKKKLGSISITEMKINSRNEDTLSGEPNNSEINSIVPTKRKKGSNSYGTFGRGPKFNEASEEPSPPISYAQETTQFVKQRPVMYGFGHTNRFATTKSEIEEEAAKPYKPLPSTKNLPRVASILPPMHGELERPKVDLTKITSDNLPRVAKMTVVPKHALTKEKVNLSTISCDNLPRVATIKNPRSSSVSELGTLRAAKVRTRMEEASNSPTLKE